MFSFSRLAENDLPFLLDVRNECRTMLHDDRLFTLEECRAWFRNVQPEFYIIHYHGARIGYFRVSNRNPAHRSLYVGADLHQDYRGKGLAQPAYDAFFAVLKHEQQVAVAWLEVLSHNTAAHRLYQKLGFVEVGRKTAIAVRSGASVDSIVMQKAL